jgi:uncharacterized membrane protein
LWFVPTLFAAGAVVLAYFAVWLDEQINEPVGARFGLVSDPTTAASFAGTIAAATLAFVAVVFATTLVAIQLAASQYSPRTVRVFIRSRVTRVTLGLFLATFVFAMVIVVSNRGSVVAAKQFAPVFSVSVLLLLTLATVFWLRRLPPRRRAPDARPVPARDDRERGQESARCELPDPPGLR